MGKVLHILIENANLKLTYKNCFLNRCLSFWDIICEYNWIRNVCIFMHGNGTGIKDNIEKIPDLREDDHCRKRYI